MLKLIHVAGAVLLLGNVTVTGFWSLFLFFKREAVPFRRVAQAILWADLVFTVLGGTMLTVSGILMTLRQHLPVFRTPWLFHGIAALAVSTLIWLLVLLPDQWRMERLPADDDARLRTVFLRWSIAGWLATGALFYGLWAMVMKPAVG